MADTVYRPTQEEIQHRARMVRLIEYWDDWIIDEIMLYDNPTIETVDRMICQYGLRMAQVKITRFCK